MDDDYQTFLESRNGCFLAKNYCTAVGFLYPYVDSLKNSPINVSGNVCHRQNLSLGRGIMTSKRSFLERKPLYLKTNLRIQASAEPPSSSPTSPTSSSTVPTSSTSTSVEDVEVVVKLPRKFNTFKWRGYDVNYLDVGPRDCRPVLFIHGFGGSINHWRKNIVALEATGELRVFAIDLLGLGASAKPTSSEVTYSIDLWADLVGDFLNAMEITAKDPRWTLIGNSIGSLVSLAASVKQGTSKIRSCALMNCSGGMVAFRYSELTWIQATMYRIFTFVLFNKIVGRRVFNFVRQRKVLRSLLEQVYVDKTAVDDTLVELIAAPAEDEGACDVFLAIINGDAGPKPKDLLLQLEWCPILVFWGEDDPWTPLSKGLHPGSKFPDFHSGLILKTFKNAGHCLHDECPALINPELVPFVLKPRRRNEA